VIDARSIQHGGAGGAIAGPCREFHSSCRVQRGADVQWVGKKTVARIVKLLAREVSLNFETPSGLLASPLKA
jgi:hypothetical protein